MGVLMTLIDSVSDDQFALFVSEANRISDVTKMVGYAPSRKSDCVVSDRIKKMSLSTRHFKNWNSMASVPTDELLVVGSARNNQTIKKRLIKENVLPYVCVICGNDGKWMGEELVLHLDHKNGNNDDNRFSNLRFLCPNCHAQTDTYGGRNNKIINGCAATMVE
jgi:5-methylcytosine-specific restriction endonuclease McrA